ncbi:hypothetical protein BaRGS_00034386 [Batillaria attramentaria]|uniref:Acyl-CoA dehydrogenase n=1 Tax=Batillaria attramentaria TaxID=370345 RepID=A0ABD0JH95_9CAEN
MFRSSLAARSMNILRRYSGNKKSTSAPANVLSSSEALDAEVGEMQNPGLWLRNSIPFARARVGNFVQEPPQLGNQYTQDTLLRSFLKRHVPEQYLAEIEADLERFGQRVATDMYDLHLRCERESPTVEQTDAWGQRVDRLITSTAWRDMHDIAAQEGLIALAYERNHGESSRLYQITKLYLYAPSSGLYSCPLAMADGAAKIIETIQLSSPWLIERAFSHLTSRDPAVFWTSGQWMTEKTGWLRCCQRNGDTTDADMTFTLARIADKEGNTVEGTRGLSLFYLELRAPDGKLNNIQIQKLKNKLGTRQLPTAELLLDGSTAFRVSDEGRGVAGISNMLTLTRLHNSLSAASSMRRMVNMARDYSTRRSAFGSVLKDYPLHIQTLARMEVETRGAELLVLEVGRLLGLEEVGVATDTEKQLMRLLVPVMKLYTGKQAIAVASEGLECFGGQGFIEDTGLPMILRDAQVLTIWEGTTNVLSLDVLRAMAKSRGGVLKAFAENVGTRLQSAAGREELVGSTNKVAKGAEDVLAFAAKNTSILETAARDFAFSIARVAIGAMLIEHAASGVGTAQDVYTAQRWCEKDLVPVLAASEANAYSLESVMADRQLVFDGYPLPSRL